MDVDSMQRFGRGDEKTRLFIKRYGCPMCKEIERAVIRYNAAAPHDKEITVLTTDDLKFKRYTPLLKQVVQEVDDLKNDRIPTPFIWYEPHVIYWKYGGPDWVETFHQLKALGGI